MRRALAATALGLLAACGDGTPASDVRVVVFGVDGLDPEMLQERIDRGELPNFARLVEEGALTALGTSWPPQSPVAWSNFITGTNPGKHGLYDFIHADPDSYGVTSSMSHTEDVGLEIGLFGYRLPLTGGGTALTRRFPAFWEVLSEAGVPCYVHRMPANFPVQETEAVTYPDMGATDLTGAASGVATLWTADASRFRSRSGESYRIVEVPVRQVDERYRHAIGLLYGPADTAKDLRDLERQRDEATAAGNFAEANRLQGRIERATEVFEEVDIHVDLGGDVPRVAVEIGGAYALAELGGWSNWMPVEFGLMWGGMLPVTGWTRVMFQSLDPLEVFAIPVQIDPWAPVTPVSTPDEASADLADAIGPYFTQGFPDAYKAYKEGLLDTAGFVSQSDEVFEERGRMLDYSLEQFDATGGLLFFYVGSLDLRCHMLWHTQDEDHPHQEPAGSYDGVPYAEQIDRVYRQVDGMLGELLARLDAMEQETGRPVELMIMSDHGFAPMHRVMHVNDWLVREGYLVLKDGVTETSMLALEGDGEGGFRPGSGPVDWSRSVAYSVGFNGIRLNRVGREAEGIVDDARGAALLEEMRAKLLALRDEDGSQVLTKVRTAAEVYAGPAVPDAPDLQLGFNVGYGASDPSALGGVTGTWQDGTVLVDNDSRWSGSHLMDPDLVRGTLITRRAPSAATDPGLEDVTATLYELFQVAPPEGLDGRPLFE